MTDINGHHGGVSSLTAVLLQQPQAQMAPVDSMPIVTAVCANYAIVLHRKCFLFQSLACHQYHKPLLR